MSVADSGWLTCLGLFVGHNFRKKSTTKTCSSECTVVVFSTRSKLVTATLLKGILSYNRTLAQLLRAHAIGAEGMGFKSWVGQIHTVLPTARHRCVVPSEEHNVAKFSIFFLLRKFMFSLHTSSCVKIKFLSQIRDISEIKLKNNVVFYIPNFSGKIQHIWACVVIAAAVA